MKLVSWNCNGALRRKLDPLLSLNADLYIVQECEDPARSHDTGYREWGANGLWRGANKDRGLGVFARPGIELEAAALDSGGLELFLPCMVAGDIALLAVWTREAGSPTFRYIGQLWKYLQEHRDFLRRGQAMCVGDFNSNACWDLWDRWWNHSDVVRELDRLGLASIYHATRSEAHGAETTPTFLMHRRPERPYHIDYAFLSHALREHASLVIGDPATWLRHSDHLPLIVEMRL